MHDLGFGFRAMACGCEVRLCAPDEATAHHWARLAIDEVRRIEKKLSRYTEDSVTAAINRAAGGPPITVDEETAALIDFGATLWQSSGGRFDLTSGVLRRAWRFDVPRPPSPEEVDALLERVGWARVEWDCAARRLRLPLDGMELDFGGIGKEYAADRAAGVLLAAGARHGFINLGGDVRAFGPEPDGRPWRIGIQHPRAAAGVTLGAIEVTSGALATSGDYERYIEVEGLRYCHILDARNGWPAQHWRAVSVAAPACVAAGACATVAMLMPRAQALAFLHEQRLAYLAVDAQGEVVRGG